MVEQISSSIRPPDIPRLKHGILEQWHQLSPEHQAALVPLLLGALLQNEHGALLLAVVESLQKKYPPPTDNRLSSLYPDGVSNSWFEQYFEDRLAQVEPGLIRRVKFRMSHTDDLARDVAVQEVRIALWEHFSAEPEEWAAKPLDEWRAYAHGCLKYTMIKAQDGRKRYRETTGSDLVEMCRTEDEVTIDDAISMVEFRNRSKPNKKTRSREIELTDLRVDLNRALERGLERLCESQQRDMPKLIADMLEGYTLMETCERHGWTRNRGVTLMRKLRTVIFEEVTGQKKTGYLGSHHPLTEAERQHIRDLYATGLSYRKVAALVGRSASAVEGVCKQYPPELVEQVRKLRQQKLSYAEIARIIGRSKSYVGWLIAAELKDGTDKQDDQREGENIVTSSIEGEDDLLLAAR